MENTERIDKAKLLSRLQAQCSRREYCCADVRKKIADAGWTEATDEMLESLKKERYVDDLRYATAFARDKSSLGGWGRLKISHALRAKGISDAQIREALGEIDEADASEKLLKMVRQKYKTLAEDPQCRLKLLRFALGRGYGYEEVESAVGKVLNNR